MNEKENTDVTDKEVEKKQETLKVPHSKNNLKGLRKGREAHKRRGKRVRRTREGVQSTNCEQVLSCTKGVGEGMTYRDNTLFLSCIFGDTELNNRHFVTHTRYHSERGPDIRPTMEGRACVISETPGG